MGFAQEIAAPKVTQESDASLLVVPRERIDQLVEVVVHRCSPDCGTSFFRDRLSPESNDNCWLMKVRFVFHLIPVHKLFDVAHLGKATTAGDGQQYLHLAEVRLRGRMLHPPFRSTSPNAELSCEPRLATLLSSLRLEGRGSSALTTRSSRQASEPGRAELRDAFRRTALTRRAAQLGVQAATASSSPLNPTEVANQGRERQSLIQRLAIRERRNPETTPVLSTASKRPTTLLNHPLTTCPAEHRTMDP